MTTAPTGQGRRHLLPLLAWRTILTPHTLRADALAGLTGAVLVVPQGIAYALLAGLPPVYGLYTAIIPTILAALFGSSRQMVNGPTAALSIALFASLQPIAASSDGQFLSLALTLTFLAGAFQLLLGLARLGALVDLVSHTVVIGFTAGAAVIIATSQLPHALGIGPLNTDGFLASWPALASRLGEMSPVALTIALTTLLLCLTFRRWLPRWPGMLMALAIATALAQWFDPTGMTIPRVDAVPRGLPPLSLPDLSITALAQLTPGAIALGLLGLVEAAAIARAMAARYPSRDGPRLDMNQEFIGQGLSNLIGPFFSGYLSSGSFTRSGLNASAGARTPLAALFSALLLIPILLLAAPLIGYLPMPAMAGALLLVAAKLIDREGIREALTTSHAETCALLITFASTLLLALEFAIYFGVLASLALYLRRTTRPPVVESTLDHVPVSLKASLEASRCTVVRIDGSLYFGASESVARRLERFQQPDLVILAAGINFIDLSGLHLLRNQARQCQARGGRLYLAWIKPDVEAFLNRAHALERSDDASTAITIREA